MKRKTWLVLGTSLLIGLGAASGGCANQPKQKGMKQEMTEKWNATRAGIVYGMAKQQYDAGDFEKSRASVKQALGLNPKHVPSLVLSAKLSMEQNQLESAERTLAGVRELDPKNAEADYLSGVIFQRWQKPEDALKAYDNASEKAPAELAYILARAEMLVALDRDEQAMELLKGKVQYFEHSPAIRDAVGQLLTQEGKYAEAVEMYRQASILSSDDRGIKERFGLALFRNKEYREAADVLSKLTKESPYSTRPDLLTALAESNLQTGNARAARAAYESATEAAPSNPSVWLGLGKVALQMNDTKRADLSLRKALAIDPTSSETNLLVGYLRLRQNKPSEALDSFTKAAALDPRDPTAVSMVGYVYEKTGQKERAMEYYGKALQLKPKDELATKLMAGVGMND